MSLLPSWRGYGLLRAIVVCSALAAMLVLPSRAEAREVTVPANVGVGPAAFMVSGPVQDDQIVHFGLRIAIEAVLDQQWLQDNRTLIPSRYRGMIEGMDELRISPSIFIPDTLIISPAINGTGMYGVTWRPISLRLPIVSDPVSFDLSAGAILTYAFIHSSNLETEQMHFFRPGLDVQADLEIPLSERVLVSMGWSSRFHIPQEIGGEFLSLGPLEDSIWHFGTPYLMFHYRFPFTTEL